MICIIYNTTIITHLVMDPTNTAPDPIMNETLKRVHTRIIGLGLSSNGLIGALLTPLRRGHAYATNLPWSFKNNKKISAHN